MRWHDGIEEVDWARTAAGYEIWRPGYPPSLFHRLGAVGLGQPGQRLLDLGTGTGVLAREFARRGCRVTGIDLEPALLDAAGRLADEEGVQVDWRCVPAESTGLPSAAFDVITAGEAWSYFDIPRAIDEVLRLLAGGGRLMTCQLNWLPRQSPVARASEELLLRFNPDWDGADEPGRFRGAPDWSRERFRVVAMFLYDEAMPFTRESWRGRLRACRGVGASLPADACDAFDTELAELLDRMVPPRFTVLHRLEATVFEPLEPGG